MELTIEGLVAVGIAQEVAQQVVQAHKSAIKDKYVPMARFEEVTEERDTARTQVSERDQQISQLSTFQGTAEELAQQVAQLQQENQQKEQEKTEMLQQERRDNAMRQHLIGKVHDVDLVLSQLDTSVIKFDGTTRELKGFNEQVDQLKQSKQFLFVNPTSTTPAGTPGVKIVGTGTPADGITPAEEVADPAAFGKKLAERAATTRSVGMDSNPYFT